MVEYLSLINLMALDCCSRWFTGEGLKQNPHPRIHPIKHSRKYLKILSIHKNLMANRDGVTFKKRGLKSKFQKYYYIRKLKAQS